MRIGRFVWLIMLVTVTLWAGSGVQKSWKIVLKTLPDMAGALKVRDRYGATWQEIAKRHESGGQLCARPSGRFAIVAVEPLAYAEADRLVALLHRDFPDAFVNRVSAETLASPDRRCIGMPGQANEEPEDAPKEVLRPADDTPVQEEVSTEQTLSSGDETGADIAPAAEENASRGETVVAEDVASPAAPSRREVSAESDRRQEADEEASTPPTPTKSVSNAIAEAEPEAPSPAPLPDEGRAETVSADTASRGDSDPWAYPAAIAALLVLAGLLIYGRSLKRKIDEKKRREQRQAEAYGDFVMLQKEIEAQILPPRRDGCDEGFFHASGAGAVGTLIGGKREPTQDVFELNRLLERLGASLGRIKNGDRICVVYDIGRNVPLRLIGDADAISWLSGVMALDVCRYMTRGSVVIQMSWRTGVEAKTMLDIAVTADAYEAAFVDGDPGEKRAIEGLAEALGGTVKMRRAADGMPSYWVRVPLGVEDANNRRKYRLPSRKLMNKKVLIVDSCPRSGWALDRMLRYFHYDVTTASHWRADEVRKESYDLLFVESGFLGDVERERRAWKLPPVVAICRSCGDQDCKKHEGPFLRRPFSHRDIFTLLVKVFIPAR